MKVFLCTFLHFRKENRIPAMTSHLHWEFKYSSVKYAIMKAKQKLLFYGHKSLQHNPSIPHTSKWEKNKCHICHTTFSNATYFQSHMIEQHGFVSDTDACFNCESTGQLGYYIPVPDQLIYMYCKECEIFKDLDTYS